MEKSDSAEIVVTIKKKHYTCSIYRIAFLFFQSLFLQRNGGAKDSVPVAEERSVVAVWLLVVHVVSRCTTQQTERHQVIEGPRQIVANVVLHRHPDAEYCDAPRSHWVAL